MQVLTTTFTLEISHKGKERQLHRYFQILQITNAGYVQEHVYLRIYHQQPLEPRSNRVPQ